MERLVCLACVLVSYFFGTFESAYFIGKARHIDIRKEGSGNPGTTNMFRVLGIKYGLLTFLCDVAKVLIAEFICYFVITYGLHISIPRIVILLYSGLGCVLGHDFPFYLHFRGGKGVAATVACFLSLWDWRLILVGAIVFFSIAFATQFISLASMSLMVSELIAFIVFSQLGIINVGNEWQLDCYIILALLAVLCIILHRKNIKRLLAGCENKFVFMSSAEMAAAKGKNQDENR